MTNAIKTFATTLFGDCPWLGVIIVAMIPVIELRGAIPFAMSAAFWGTKALPWWQAFLFGVVGSTLPAFFILPLLKPFFAWLKKTKLFKKMVEAFERKFSKKGKVITDRIETVEHKKKRRLLSVLGLTALVAVPLPLTGTWTASGVGAYINMRYWDGILAVFIGNLIAGAIITAVCVLLPGAENIIFFVFLGLIAVVIIVAVIWALLKRTKKVEEISAD